MIYLENNFKKNKINLTQFLDKYGVPSWITGVCMYLKITFIPSINFQVFATYFYRYASMYNTIIVNKNKFVF